MPWSFTEYVKVYFLLNEPSTVFTMDFLCFNICNHLRISKIVLLSAVEVCLYPEKALTILAYQIKNLLMYEITIYHILLIVIYD